MEVFKSFTTKNVFSVEFVLEPTESSRKQNTRMLFSCFVAYRLSFSLQFVANRTLLGIEKTIEVLECRLEHENRVKMSVIVVDDSRAVRGKKAQRAI